MKDGMKILSMRPTVPEWYNEIHATSKLGYRWFSFRGRPVCGHPDYESGDEIRVCQLFSPEQLNSERWKQYLIDHEGRNATGDEPLAYTYCSSGCSVAAVPDLINDELAKKLSEVVKTCTIDVGNKLADVVRDHFVQAMAD